MSGTYLVDSSSFEKLFPFSFITDEEGRVLRLGPSLKKLDTNLKLKCSMDQYYTFSKPQNIKFVDAITRFRGEMIILQDMNSEYQLMGQIIQTKRKNRFVFVVNLFINDVKKLNYLHLTFSDFAIQDQIFDFLMLLQTHERAIREADVINKKLAEAHQIAIKASALKSQFLANMSHELRTPMNGVLGMASVLSETELSDDQKEYVQCIVSSGENMLSLINDILDLSKIEAGYIQMQKNPFNLLDIVDDVANVVQVAAAKKSLKIIKLIETNDNLNFIGDADRLRQVLLNFVGNSVKFTLKGSVTIKVKITESKSNPLASVLSFVVADTGIGMNEETLKEIFNPFVQGDISTTKQFGGTGLGLSICKKIITAMGGNLGVNSEVGVGSEFWFNVELEQTSVQQLKSAG